MSGEVPRLRGAPSPPGPSGGSAPPGPSGGAGVRVLSFPDRTVVVAAGGGVGRVGHVLSAEGGLGGGWEVRVLLGAAGEGSPWEHWARGVAEAMAAEGHGKALLLCLGVRRRDASPALLRELIGAVKAQKGAW